jgi:hypothetical protein
LNILAQRNNPNEVPISHGSGVPFRKPDVVFITEDELIGVHRIDRTAPDWRTTLYTKCQLRLPKDTARWRQFKVTCEFKRKKNSDDTLRAPIPKELRSCRDGKSPYIRPQKLGESVTHVVDAPVSGEPVPSSVSIPFSPRSQLILLQAGGTKRVQGNTDAGHVGREKNGQTGNRTRDNPKSRRAYYHCTTQPVMWRNHQLQQVM